MASWVFTVRPMTSWPVAIEALDVLTGNLQALRENGLELLRVAGFGDFAEERERRVGAGFEGGHLQAEDLGGVVEGEAVDLGRGVRELARGGGELFVDLLVHGRRTPRWGHPAECRMVRCSIDGLDGAVQQPLVASFRKP